MPVRVRAVETRERIIMAMRLLIFREWASNALYALAELALLGVGCAFTIVYFTAGNTPLRIALLATVVPSVLAGISGLLWLWLPMRMAKKVKNLWGSVTTYAFSESELVIESTLDSANGASAGGYGSLEKVCERKDVFILRNSLRQMFVLHKSDIIEGSAMDLRVLLQRNLPPGKYKIRGA